MNIAAGHNQFQNIPRRVAKFREIRFRDGEKGMFFWKNRQKNK